MSFGKTTPILRIFDEAKALEFYVDFLGFKIDWQHRFEANFPLYLQVSRGECVLHLSEHHGDACPGSALRIETDELEAFQQQLMAKDYKFSHPQIQAIVVAYLDPDQAGEVLGHFDHKVRLDIVLRVSSLNTVQPAALKELNQILEKQFSGNSNASRTTLGGIKRAADIMNFLDSSVEGQLMDSIREIDDTLSGQIEDLMFVFNNLSDVDDRGIQALLREVSSDVLVLALKGSDENVKEKIFKNMSKRASELLRDDLEAKGPVRVSDVETAQKEILTIARRMAEAGEIVLGGKGGEEMI